MQHTAAEEFSGTLRATCLGTRIGRLHRATARLVDHELRSAGVSSSQLEILSMLTLRRSPTRPSEIADVLMAERSTISRNLAQLDDRGWITAVQRSPTGRAMTVGITPEGEAALAAARPAWEAAQERLVASLGPRALGELDRWLAALASSDGTGDPSR